MLFELSEEQTMLTEMVADFTEKEIKPRDAWMDVNGFDEELHRKMADAGLMTLPVPREYGGAGCDAVTCALVIQEIAKGSASTAINLDSFWLASDVILHFASEEQKRKYLPLVASGKKFAFALTESSGGSDAAALRSTASRTEDGWVLNGGKAWITNNEADYYIIMAKTDVTAGARGISAFIFDRNVEGLAVGKHEDKSGLRGSVTGELSFDHIHLSDDALLGKEGAGFKYAMAALDGARINVAAISTGIAAHAAELAKEYALERSAFGRPISEYQGISFRFADMAAKIHAMKLLYCDAARIKDTGKRCTLEASEAKLLCSEWATEIALSAQQIFGGNGVSKEYNIERLVRDAKVLEILEGTSEIQRMLIGNMFLGKK